MSDENEVVKNMNRIRTSTQKSPRLADVINEGQLNI